jgi:hypothetical protein
LISNQDIEAARFEVGRSERGDGKHAQFAGRFGERLRIRKTFRADVNDDAQRRAANYLHPTPGSLSPLVDVKGMAFPSAAADEYCLDIMLQKVSRLLLDRGEVERAVRLERRVRRGDQTCQFDSFHANAFTYAQGRFGFGVRTWDDYRTRTGRTRKNRLVSKPTATEAVVTGDSAITL